MRHSIQVILLALVSAVLISAPALAHDHIKPKPHKAFKFLGGAGFTFGGEDLYTAYFDDDTSEDIKSGEFIDIKVGFTYQAAESPIMLQSTVGYFFDSFDAENGDGSFSRIPVELLAFYSYEKHQFGLGGSYHTSVEFDVDTPDHDFKLDMDNSLGLVVEYGYRVAPNITVAIRGVKIDYDADELTSEIEGDHVGIYGYVSF